MSYYDYTCRSEVPFKVLEGQTLVKIVNDDNDRLGFFTSAGKHYNMEYYQDCCASCSIEDICGDLNDLLDTPILLAEEISSKEPSPEVQVDRDKEEAEAKAKDEYYYSPYESETWTFYKLSTIKGSVTIRWYGSSNGYYSESATFEEITEEKDDV